MRLLYLLGTVVLVVGCGPKLSEAHKQLVRNARRDFPQETYLSCPSFEALDEIPGKDAETLRELGKDALHWQFLHEQNARYVAAIDGSHGDYKQAQDEALANYKRYLTASSEFDSACSRMLQGRGVSP